MPIAERVPVMVPVYPITKNGEPCCMTSIADDGIGNICFLYDVHLSECVVPNGGKGNHPGPTCKVWHGEAGGGLAELVRVQREYIALLGQEIDSLVGLAYVHGWRSKPERVERGEALRQRIGELSCDIPPDATTPKPEPVRPDFPELERVVNAIAPMLRPTPEPVRYGISWGAWECPSGIWHPNERLDISADEQHAANMKNGFSCEHRYMPKMCPFCNRPVEDKKEATP